MNKLTNRFSTLAILSTLAASLTGGAMAQASDAGKAAAPAATASAADMADGEIRKVDKSTKTLKIKHGEIKSLDMPAMTMLFQVKDPAMLDLVKVGDKVKFRADNSGGPIIVTDIQVIK